MATSDLPKNERPIGVKVDVPASVQKAANLSLEMRKKGFKGGTRTGWRRAKQLTKQRVDLSILRVMRTWFARHGPDAKNGGTSYPGYLEWVEDGRPMDEGFSEYRGAVSWLLWGGNPAYKWLKSKQVRTLLKEHFPKLKRSSPEINL